MYSDFSEATRTLRSKRCKECRRKSDDQYARNLRNRVDRLFASALLVEDSFSQYVTLHQLENKHKIGRAGIEKRISESGLQVYKIPHKGGLVTWVLAIRREHESVLFPTKPKNVELQCQDADESLVVSTADFFLGSLDRCGLCHEPWSIRLNIQKDTSIPGVQWFYCTPCRNILKECDNPTKLRRIADGLDEVRENARKG